METTKLSSKGQVIIPKPVRSARGWEVGQELMVVDMGDGVLLRPRHPFEATNIGDVASCLKFTGKPKSLGDMQAAIKKGVAESHNGGD